MNRVVYVGGFANGQKSADRVGNALGHYFDGVDVFTFSQQASNPEETLETIRRAGRGATVMTHSMGVEAIRYSLSQNTLPDSVEIVGGPRPKSRLRLLGDTVIKTARINTPGLYIRSVEDFQAVMGYNADSVIELARHPVANFRPFLDGTISRTDALAIAEAARASEVGSSLLYTNNDRYYGLSSVEQDKAEHLGIEVYKLPGEHDELPIRPVTFLKTYFEEYKDRDQKAA